MPGINDILNNQDILSLYILVQVFDYFNPSGAFCSIPIAGHGHKIKRNRNRQMLCQLRRHKNAPFQHADQMKSPSCVILIHLLCHLLYPLLNLSPAD